MNAKILTVIVSICTLCVVSMSSCSDDKDAKVDLIDAVPDGFSLIIKTSNADSLSSLFSGGDAVLGMLYSPKSELKMPVCSFVESLVDDGIFDGHLKSDVLVAVKKDGNSGLCQLYVCQTDLSESKDVDGVVASLKKSFDVEERDFNGVKIVKCKSSERKATFWVSFTNGIAIISTSARNLEESLQCLEGKCKKLKDNPSFAKAYTTSGKNEFANVFVDTHSFSDIFAGDLFSDNYLIKNFKAIDSWFSFDIISGSPLSLSGFVIPGANDVAFTSFIKSQPAVSFNSLTVIPEKASAYILMSFLDAKRYEEALCSYLQFTGSLKKRDEQVDAMNKSFGVDAKSKFYSLVKQEFAYIVMGSDADAEKGAFVACGLQSQSSAELEVSKMVKPESKISIGGSSQVNVYKMPYNDIPAALFGDIFSNCRGNYVCFVNNYMVFANTVEDIRMFVHEVSLNNTMKSSISHHDFLTKFSTNSTMFVYYSFPRGLEILKRLFTNRYASMIDSRKAEMRNNGICGIQLKNVDGMVYCNLSFGEADKSSDNESELIWETNVGTSLATKPYVVKNHDTGAKEIIVQDKDDVLYLFDYSGQEIWHIQLDGAIISPIVQVDAYNNGKLQYLFSTREKIYLMDRLGNNLPQYPLQLRSEATCPVAVFDYENNHNYRLFVACNDNMVYVYDIGGNILKGWDFSGTENEVNSDILHYVVSSEDFIVFHDAYKAYFVARNGSSKMEIPAYYKFSNNNFYCDLTGTSKFVTTDETGTIRRFFRDNRQDSIKIKEFSPDHYFCMKDIDMDGNPDYIFTDSTRIEVYGNNCKLMFDYDFGFEVSNLSFYRYGGQLKIGVTTADKKLYLIGINGSIEDGFPLEGETPFSIFEASEGTGTYCLVAGLKRGRLGNYKITK